MYSAKSPLTCSAGVSRVRARQGSAEPRACLEGLPGITVDGVTVLVYLTSLGSQPSFPSLLSLHLPPHPHPSLFSFHPLSLLPPFHSIHPLSPFLPSSPSLPPFFPSLLPSYFPADPGPGLNPGSLEISTILVSLKRHQAAPQLPAFRAHYIFHLHLIFFFPSLLLI